MKALVISPQPFFTPRGTPFSVYYRTMIESELNVTIDLLTYGEGQNVDLPGVRIIRIPRFKHLGNVRIGPSFLKLFLDFFIVLWTLMLLIRNRYDVVHAHEESIFFCVFLKPIFKFKLIYDMHSSLPQQLSNFKFTTSKLLIGIFKYLEDLSLRKSDIVITICQDLADYVEKKIPIFERHFLIENSIFEDVRVDACLNIKEVEKEIQNQINALLGKRELIVYTGTLEPYQGIDILINAFKKAHDLNNEIFLVVAGGTPEQVNYYKNLAHSLNIQKHSTFLGRIDQKSAKLCTNMASVLISPRSSGTNTPLKIYEQLASGIPLVATDIYSHTQVLNNNVAILVNPDPDSMAQGIIHALGQEGRNVIQGALGLYNEKYSRPAYTDKMKRILSLL